MFDREIMPRKTFHSPCERFYWYPPRGYEWSSLLVFYSLLHPVLMGISRDSTNSEGCSVLSFTENEIIFLNCSQSVRLSLLGGSGSIPLTASCQTAVSENAPPSLGCSLLFQPLLISAYISAEHEVAAQHINSLVTGWVWGWNSTFCSLKNMKLWDFLFSSGWSLCKGNTLLKTKRKPDFKGLPEEYKFP